MPTEDAGARALAGEARPIAGRYVIEGELARGAMGAVYQVSDLAGGGRLALKRLLGVDPKLTRMFEREYHTLVGLKHPRIIEVHDYGIDRDGPFYTMELLPGSDLREAAPLDYRTACSYLRDVASSLALLHARRLLHRDLSPRNVRVTPDGRCKLIDFGGLAGFGIPDVVVGTPPCVPPEALHHAAMDQRADLFSLGALSYWLLTGRHAYPARELSALPVVWRSAPARPSDVAAALGDARLPDVPPALDELVMSLLTLNPLGRPASAAEVIDKLELIGGLARESDETASRSYLLGVDTVGRKRERERLHRRLADALRGKGSCVVIEAAAGMGSTRLLSELTVEAQIAGALPLLVDGETRREPYGMVHGIIAEALRAARDDLLAAAAGNEPILARLSPVLGAELGFAADATDLSELPGELRRRLQTALTTLLLALARRRTLLLAVDNVHRIDDASAALLATLASEVASHGLLVVVGHKPEQLASAPAALRVLHQSGARMVLRGLQEEEVSALVKLWFGDVENSGRLADWLHRVSGGNPQACSDLAGHLVRTHVARYIDGAWVLPQELPASELPTNLEQILQQRATLLPEAARKLAEALSVHRGQLQLEQCLLLAEAECIAEPYAALELLVRDNVLVSAGDAYHFGHDGLRETLLAGITKERRTRLHRQIGALIERGGAGGIGNLLDAGWHLLHGGEAERGARLLADAGLRLTLLSDEMRAAVPALRAALDVYARLRRPDHELLRLLAPLAMAGYYVDRRLADELGELTLDTFERVLGLARARRWRPLLGRKLALYLSIGLAALRHAVMPGLGGIVALRRSLSHYISCVIALIGTATVCLDRERAQQRANRLELLAGLGQDDHAIAHTRRFAQLLARLPEERVMEVVHGCRALLVRLNAPEPIPDLPAAARAILHSGVLYALGSMEVFRDGAGALECAQKLQQRGLKLDERVADQLRTLHHAMRGEMVLAEMYRARVEMHAMQAGSAWQAEVWVPSSTIMVYVLTLDTIGLKRTSEQLDLLAQQIPSLARHAELARGEYHHMKGEHEIGFRFTAHHLERTADREFLGRSFAVANHARALNHLGRHAEAKAEVEPLIARLNADDRSVVALYANLYRELAHAHAGLDEPDAALAIIDELLERHARSQHPLLLGNLHASAAAIAVGAGDVERALAHAAQMEQWFRPTGNPALISQCEGMLRRVRRLSDDNLMSSDPPAMDTAIEDAAGSARSARSLLSQCQGPEQRANFALQLLLNHVRARAGFLFASVRGGVVLKAPQHGEEPPPELLAQLRADIAARGEDDEGVTLMTRGTDRASLPPPMPESRVERVYRNYLLTLATRDDLRVVGALAVVVGDKPLRPAQPSFLQAIARSLFEAGDAGAGAEPRAE